MDGLTVNWNVLNQITEARSEKELDPYFLLVVAFITSSMALSKM